ncbi:MAG TPA: antibiotic ABC transporter permease [Ruminococcaceae bacterium]|nr:antibiotic ABC transporter permease [Oscillospiraceae bacterium]HCT15822.1 antibiotic ABC transporter permease [Oscillospiraceae bacterium]
MKRIAKFIAYHPRTITIIAVLLLIPAAIGYINTFVNYDILSYLPGELDSVKGENELDETFNSASMSFLVIEDMPSKDIAALKEKIAKVDNVSSVIWVDDIADISIPQEAIPQVVKDIFYSKDGKCTMMLIQYKYKAVTDQTMKAIEDVRALLNKQCFLSGMGVIMKDTRDLADSQAPIFIAIAIAIALVVMTFCMESWVEPWVLLAALCMAVVYNMGTNFIFGQISYITQCIAAILQLGVTMDYSVFLIDRFEEEKPKFADKRDAMASAIQGAFISLSGSSLTTIFGFLALCFMDLSLGKDIGLVMAKGVVFGVVTVAVVLPALVLQCDKAIHKYQHRSFIPKFDKLNNFVLNHKKIWVAVFLILFIPSYIMQSNVNVYYSMDRMLPDNIGCIEALNKMKEEFNMATSHFIIVDDSLDASDLVKMENEIKETAGVTNMVAYNSFVGSGIPDSMIPDELKSIAKAGGRQMILVNTSYVAATDECNEQLTKINNIVKKYDKDGYVTGEGAMYKDLIDITDHDFKLTSVLSILSIFILIAIIFKSISIPTILVMSIELAIFVNKAISFATGTTLSFIAPTIIGCVQLGATVDYAILLTTRFREEMRNGHSKLDAIKIAANASDRSIFQSALVFFGATFGVFLTCDIKIVKEVCLLLARGSLISAGVIVFMLTPLLLVLEGVIEKTTYDFLGKKLKAKIKKKKETKTADNNA